MRVYILLVIYCALLAVKTWCGSMGAVPGTHTKRAGSPSHRDRLQVHANPGPTCNLGGPGRLHPGGRLSLGSAYFPRGMDSVGRR